MIPILSLVLVAVVVGKVCGGERRDPNQILLERAQNGDAAAMNILGKMHRDGEGVARDYAEAAKWFRKAAEENGAADAQNNLGELYARGNGVPRNLIEAAKWFKEAAGQGHAAAENNLGYLYRTGLGHVGMNKAKAASLFASAAAKGHADAQNNLALIYAETAFNGEFVDEDRAKAMELFLKSAEQGNRMAQINLGVILANGKWVPMDLEQSKELLRKAAAQGNEMAAYILDNIEKHKDAALEAGLPGAIPINPIFFDNSILGPDTKLYLDGPKVDPKELEWYRWAAQRGDKFAQEFLGHHEKDGNAAVKP
jgi:TPR repeat protein